MGDNRPSWDVWAMGIAAAVSVRMDCTRDQVGAVILDTDRNVIGVGYGGTAPGRRGCLEGGCPRGRLTPDELPHGASYDEAPGYCISTHAEVNAMFRAGASKLEGATLYTTRAPCVQCERLIVNSGIRRLVYPGEIVGQLIGRFV